MRRRITDKNILLVYAAIFLLGLAYGIAISLVGLFLDARGFDKPAIGSLAAFFALGIVALSLPAGAILRRFSARWTLVASLFGYAAAVSVFPFLPGYGSIAAVRFLDGAFSVGIWVSCETILLSRAGDENKASVTSLYAISMAVGYVVGPLLARGIVAAASMPAAFLTSGLVASLAGLLVWLRLEPDVEAKHGGKGEGEGSSGGAFGLLWKIKTSCFATFAYGYFQASVVLFLPLFLVERKGITLEQTILVPACFAAGMLLFSNVAGRLGDRFGHLSLMRGLAVVGAAMTAGFVLLDSFAWMCAAVFVAGATLASISPISLALQGVVVRPEDYGRANSIYNAFYAAGMLLGPPVSSALYGRAGGPAMLYHLAALWVAFVIFSVVYFRDDPAARRGEAALLREA